VNSKVGHSADCGGTEINMVTIQFGAHDVRLLIFRNNSVLLCRLVIQSHATLLFHMLTARLIQDVAFISDFRYIQDNHSVVSFSAGKEFRGGRLPRN
jgi:hypothetical protein